MSHRSRAHCSSFKYVRSPMIRIGVIGYGYWGPNIVRNFHAHDCSEVVLVCDKNPKCQERLSKAHPGIAYTTDEKEILNSPNIDAVAVRSEEHTSELQSLTNLVCRLL